jgi:hypothetical protein
MYVNMHKDFLQAYCQLQLYINANILAQSDQDTEDMFLHAFKTA